VAGACYVGVIDRDLAAGRCRVAGSGYAQREGVGSRGQDGAGPQEHVTGLGRAVEIDRGGCVPVEGDGRLAAVWRGDAVEAELRAVDVIEAVSPVVLSVLMVPW